MRPGCDRYLSGYVPIDLTKGLIAMEAIREATAVLDFDVETADHAARIRLQLEAARTSIGPSDLLIAATARRHGRTLDRANAARRWGAT